MLNISFLILILVLFFIKVKTCEGLTNDFCRIKIRSYSSCGPVKYNEYCVEDGIQAFSSPYYNSSNCNTIIIGMSFRSNSSGNFIVPLIEALVSRCTFNIFLLDNTNNTDVNSRIEYPKVVYNTYKDSKKYAAVFNEALDKRLLSAKCVIGLGFSVGGQLLGQVCRQLKEKCCHIYGMDVAGPLYVPTALLPQNQLISRTDACNVVLTQCNRGGFGTVFTSGHVNIIVNNGFSQPGCTGQPPLCSHKFCLTLMEDAIRRPGACVATNKTDTFTLSLPPTFSCGSCSSSQHEIFNLKTSTEEPTCRA